MTEFFQRSVQMNPSTGIPQPFDVDVDISREGFDSYSRNEPMVEIPHKTRTGAPPIPHIVRCDPNNGKLAGGAFCDVAGSGFFPGSQIYFNNRLATEITVFGDGLIRSKPPAYVGTIPSSGTDRVDIKVVNADTSAQTFQDVLVDGYTYIAAPRITALNPNHGPGTGGTVVTVTGQYFGFGSNIIALFDTSQGTAVTPVDATHIQVTSPTHATGLVDFFLILPDAEQQVGSFGNGYTYDSPGGTTGGQDLLFGYPFIIDPHAGYVPYVAYVQAGQTYQFPPDIVAVFYGANTVDTTCNATFPLYVQPYYSSVDLFPSTLQMVAGFATPKLSFVPHIIPGPGYQGGASARIGAIAPPSFGGGFYEILHLYISP